MFSRSSKRRLRRLTLIVAFFLAGALSALAQPASIDAGFRFLRIEPSARAAAMGGSFAAVYSADVNALFYNPAALNEDMHGGLSLSYLNHLAGLNAGFLAYSRTVGDLGSFGVGVRYLNYGDIERADADGRRSGDTFGASDLALTLGVGRAVTDRFRYGASAHFITSGIDAYRATALALDAGVLYTLPAEQLTASASIHHFGVTLSSFGETDDQLPVDLRVSVSKRLRYVPLLLSITGYNLHDLGGTPVEDASAVNQVLYHVAVGGEFELGSALRLRLGYNHRRHDELRTKERLDTAGLSVGGGLQISDFQFDYAFNSWLQDGNLHQFTVRTSL